MRQNLSLGHPYHDATAQLLALACAANDAGDYFPVGFSLLQCVFGEPTALSRLLHQKLRERQAKERPALRAAQQRDKVISR